MFVRIEDIPDSGLQIDEPVPSAFIDETLPGGQDLHSTAPGRADLRIERHGGRVLVRGAASAEITGTCAFCLKPMTLPLQADIQMFLFKAVKGGEANEKAEAEEDDGLGDEVDVGSGPFDGKVVQWGELVREQLLLSLPIAPRCKDDCLGLCPVCGVDRNLTMCQCAEQKIDPRWEKLRLIKLID